jgi:hypothetical protein
VKFYRLLDSIPWVRDHLERKLGLVLFIGTQLTLVFYIAVKLAFDSPLEAGILLLVASFNLGAWVAAYLSMRIFLKPVEATAEALRAYLERRPVPVLPSDGHDIVGQLMRDADYIGKRTELESTQLKRAVDDDLLTGLYSRGAGKRRLLEDAARSERGKMKFHFAFFSLHGMPKSANATATNASTRCCSTLPRCSASTCADRTGWRAGTITCSPSASATTAASRKWCAVFTRYSSRARLRSRRAKSAVRLSPAACVSTCRGSRCKYSMSWRATRCAMRKKR